MDFDEMKTLWDSQNNEPLYGFNEKALHNHIISKKNQAWRTTNVTELIGIISNALAGGLVLGMNAFKQTGNVSMYLLSVWMLGTALYFFISRIRRIKGDYRFDRSLRGDVSHAISVATYQVRLSFLMRWNMLPIGILVMAGFWESGTPIWFAVATIVVLAFANYVAGWEHNIYRKRKRELEVLKNKLENG